MGVLRVEGGGGGEICFLVFFTLVSLVQSQLDILAQKVSHILSSQKGLSTKIELVIINIFNEDIPP